jgi:hypothetical protein
MFIPIIFKSEFLNSTNNNNLFNLCQTKNDFYLSIISLYLGFSQIYCINSSIKMDTKCENIRLKATQDAEFVNGLLASDNANVKNVPLMAKKRCLNGNSRV